MPEGGDLALYDAKRDWGSKGDAQRAFYDLLRDSNMSHDAATKAAEDGARKFAEKNGEAKLADGVARSTATPVNPNVSRARFKTPYFGPHRGKMCRVNDDGSLTPVHP